MSSIHKRNLADLRQIKIKILLSFFKTKKAFYRMLKLKKISKVFYLHFDQSSYLYANPDVAESVEKGMMKSALMHFVRYGYDEVKEGKRRLGNELPYFNEALYLDVFPDVRSAVKKKKILSAYDHYLIYGYREMLDNKREMIGEYPFLIDETMLSVLKASFDEVLYIEANPDIREMVDQGVIKDGWDHFLLHGINEVRRGERALYSGIPPMSESCYVQINSDIQQALKKGTLDSAFRHFLLYGAKEILEKKRSIDGLGLYQYNQPVFNQSIVGKIEKFDKKPLISVIMPVYNVDPKWLDLAIQSIRKQWYKNWELCIADDASTREETLQFLQTIEDPRIKIVFLERNLNISGASNAALHLASGEYVALMDNDDELAPDAFYEMVKSINESDAEFLYSDEDKIEINGSFVDPHFKADYAPETFLSQNYLNHLTVIKKSLIDDVSGWFIGLEGSQDYDLYLRVLEQTDKIMHIPKVLYHWRKLPGSTAAEFGDKSYAQDAGLKALESAIKRRGISAKVQNGKYPGTYRVKYDILDNPLVSIIIPFKDKPELLDICINSILGKSTYHNYEIVGISNNSIEAATFTMMKSLETKDNRISFYEYNVPFNYSQINNYAVKNFAKGEQIILLNNDIEIITPDWIESLLEFSQQEDIGAVGAKLYYPDNKIQHAGVIVGIGGVAGHSHKYFGKNETGYFSRLGIVQNVSAVTGACLMVKKILYDQMDGLNEKDLKIAFNDVDFCLRLQETGYKNIFTPYCEAYHHESISRGVEDDPEKIKRFNKEVEYMMKRHEKILTEGDPYYNINLTLEHENFKIK